MELAPGLLAELRVVVSEADTAIAAGSGDVPVLATPRLLALAEAASVAGDLGVGIALFVDEMQDIPAADVSALCAACH